MVDQDNANSFVAVDLHDCFFEGWRAEKPPHIIAESIRFSGYTQSVRIKLAIPVLVMKQDNRVLSRIEIGEDHCTFLRRVGPQSDCGKPVWIIEEPSLSDNSMARVKLSRLS
jgi:hypothetical protein